MALPLAAVMRAAAGAVGASLLTGRNAPRIRLPGLGPGGAQITVRSNVRGEIRRLDKLLRDHDAIIALALNKAVRSARTQTIRRLSKAKNVPAKVLRKRVKIWPARRHEKPIHADMWIGTKRPIKAKELAGAVGSTRSGYVKVGKRVFRQAFRARMPGGHEGIFTRAPHARHRERPDGQMTQLPIQEAVVQLMPEADYIGASESREAMDEVFRAELARLARLRLSKQRI